MALQPDTVRTGVIAIVVGSDFMPNPDPESGHLPRRIMTTQPKLCGAGASQLA